MWYITTNASNRIPERTQLLLWMLFDQMQVEKDYLQIFNMSIQNGKQHIRHHQEQPPWSEEILFLTDAPVAEKIYIITEGEYSTMMLAEDY